MAMHQITKAIWIGNYHDALDREMLHVTGIKSVLCLDGCLAGMTAAQVGVDRLDVRVLIDGEGNAPEYFLGVVNLLREAVQRHPPLLVQCFAGRSRSPAVVCKYLMHCEGCDLASAMARITANCPAEISAGLQKLLEK